MGTVLIFNGPVGNVNKGNIVMVDGKIVGETSGNMNEIDKKLSVDCHEARTISVASTIATVEVSVSKEDESLLSAHLHGNVSSDGKIDFDIKKKGYCIVITCKNDGSQISENLTLKVIIPRKIFEAISIETSSGGILLERNVSIKQVSAKTMSGKVSVESDSQKIDVNTMSGSISLNLNANQDIEVDASTMSGNVEAKFQNIRDIMLKTSTMSGSVRNSCSRNGKYMGNVTISTMSGNIEVM